MIMEKRGLNRGQFWYADYLIGLSVFMIIGFLFFRTFVDVSYSNSLMDELVEDGISISNALMSDGYLHNEWLPEEGEQVQGRIGFVNNGRLNITSYTTFKSLVQYMPSDPAEISGYELSKYLIGTRYDYITYFEDENGNIIQNSISNPDIELTILGRYSDTISISNAEGVVKFTRFVWVDEYEDSPNNDDGKGKILRMIVVVWK